VTSLLRALKERALKSLDAIVDIPIDRCYHYRAFRYGGFGNNLYEDYVVGLATGENRAELRRHFAESILRCRPRTMDDVLGLDLGQWPIWSYPWNRPSRAAPSLLSDPALNPDIVCHDCPSGVLASHINREFSWLEGAYASIVTRGYRPDTYGYIHCQELVGASSSAFIVLDGNHRMSALHALGHATVRARVSPLKRVVRADVKAWPRVREGSLTESRALLVFDRYFAKANPPLREMNPAILIEDEAPMWQNSGGGHGA
jgi:hypothetical protein